MAAGMEGALPSVVAGLVDQARTDDDIVFAAGQIHMNMSDRNGQGHAAWASRARRMAATPAKR